MRLDQDAACQPLVKLRKSLKRFPKQPRPPLVHDVRTRARRIQATVKALRLSAQGKKKRLLASLRRLRKRAGAVRDMDVLTERALKLDSRDHAEGLVPLLEHLGARRRKAARALCLVVREDAKELRRRLKRCMGEIDKRLSESGSSSGDGDGSQPGSSSVTAEVSKLVRKLQSFPPLDSETLHPYRRQAKKLRYVLKANPQTEQQAFTTTLDEVTDAIGEWHDWEALLAIASDVLDEEDDRYSLLRALHEIADAKYAHALTITNKMRTTYLSIDPTAFETGEEIQKPELAHPVASS